MRFNTLMIFLFFIALTSSQEAHAYINPGTGSCFFQVVISFFMGILFFFKNMIKKLTSFTGKNIEPAKEGENDN